MNIPKFRAYIKDIGGMHQVEMLDFTLKRLGVYLNPDITQDGIKWGKLHILTFDEIELMQWTGLRDIKKIEIYQNDKVSYVNEYEDFGIINFEDGCYFVKSSDDCIEWIGLSSSSIRNNQIEVIGNLYQNHELLEEK